METLYVVILLVAAPWVYFVAGLPWAVAGRQLSLAPLWGAGVLGLVVELAAIGGFDVFIAVVAVLAAHAAAGGSALRSDAAVRKGFLPAVVTFARCYVIALLPLVVAPFAIPGSWGGDWLLALESGQYLLHAQRFTPELLARPPLFGAASVPLLLFGPPFAGFQIFCAVASAGALQVFRSALPPTINPRLIWVLAGSVFFLQISANAWPKFLSAAYLLAAWQALAWQARARLVFAGGLLGLAIATHQSAVLFAPLLLTQLLDMRSGWAARMQAVVVVLATAFACVAPWELHTLAAYGLDAKISANPAVSQRVAAVPAWLNMLLVGVSTVVAWSPIDVLRHWIQSADRFTAMRIAHEAYWFATESFNAFAGSLVGLLLPWWIALGRLELWRRLRAGWAGLTRPQLLTLAMALVGQIALNPFYSAGGSLQTGWVPVGIALTLWFACDLHRAPAESSQAVLRYTAWIGAAPWIGFNLGLTAALSWSPRLRPMFVENDLRLLDAHGWTSLGMWGFPWIQLLVGAGALVVWRRDAASARPELMQTQRGLS